MLSRQHGMIVHAAPGEVGPNKKQKRGKAAPPAAPAEHAPPPVASPPVQPRTEEFMPDVMDEEDAGHSMVGLMAP